MNLKFLIILLIFLLLIYYNIHFLEEKYPNSLFNTPLKKIIYTYKEDFSKVLC